MSAPDTTSASSELPIDTQPHGASFFCAASQPRLKILQPA
jgi:hypothetical protein